MSQQPCDRDGPGHGRWRRGLRLTGFMAQVLLCAGLTIWAAVTREYALVAITAILGLTAVWLLLREVRGRSDSPAATAG